METVSVIVPIYNVEKYLKRCVDSIRNQTYQQIEILLIDDGSPDGCPLLCEKYARMDPRIRAIHQKNTGLGGARNRGLLEATGQYILYIDSDDWIAEDCVEIYVSKARENNADLIVSNSFFQMSGEEIKIHYSLPEGDYTCEDRKEILLTDGLVSMCMKFFRREWLLQNNLFQPPIYTYEDWGAYPNMIYRAGKVCVLRHPYYYYTLAREGGITAGSELKLIQGFEQSISFMLRFMKDNQLWEQKCGRLKYYCLKDYYMRVYLNKKSQNCEAKKVLERIKKCILTKKFGDFNNIETNNYIVLGSFSLRWEVQRGVLISEKVDRHFCFSSIVSVFSSVKNYEVIHENAFRQRQMEWELGSVLLGAIKGADEHTLLFVDFLEERFNLLEVEPEIYVTESDAFWESNLKDIGYIKKIPGGSDEYMALWEKACDKFVNLLRKYIKPEQIILIRNRMSIEHGDFVQRLSFEKAGELNRINQRLEQMEDYFCRHMQGITIIENDREYHFADPNLPYGCRPEYANNAWYAKVGYEIFEKIV